MKRIIVRCPICNSQKNEIITDELIDLRKSIDRGMLLIGISKGNVCEHPIYLEIDKNFSVRKAYTSDEAEKLKAQPFTHYLKIKE